MNKRLIKDIAKLSLPAVITNITTPLLALTDTAIAGHLGGAVFIAAIAIGGTVFNMLYWLCGFLRMGSSGLTAQAYGAENVHEIHAMMQRSLALALGIGCFMVILQHPICYLSLAIIEAESTTHIFASEYINICIYGAPAALGMMALTGWCIGIQNSRLPMWTSLFIVTTNIIISTTLTIGLNMGIKGLAIGTIAAQWLGFCLCFGLCIIRYGWIWIELKGLRSGIWRFFRINADIFLRTLCLVTVTVWFTRTGAEQGALILAVNALLMQLFTLFSFFMDGLAFAAEAICGRFLGSCDFKMLRYSIRTTMSIGALLSTIFTGIYLLFGQNVLELLCEDPIVINEANEYLIWAISIPLTAFTAFIWDGIFIGMTRTRALLLSMALATCVYFTCYSALFSHIGNHGLWIAFLAYLFTRGIVLTFIGRQYL